MMYAEEGGMDFMAFYELVLHVSLRENTTEFSNHTTKKENYLIKSLTFHHHPYTKEILAGSLVHD